jgi:Cys-rich protein (TIGR01571 family)
MLNTIAFILQHPLVISVFIFWGVAPDWHKGHEILRSAFIRIQAGDEKQHTTADISSVTKLSAPRALRTVNSARSEMPEEKSRIDRWCLLSYCIGRLKMPEEKSSILSATDFPSAGIPPTGAPKVRLSTIKVPSSTTETFSLPTISSTGAPKVRFSSSKVPSSTTETFFLPTRLHPDLADRIGDGDAEGDGVGHGVGDGEGVLSHDAATVLLTTAQPFTLLPYPITFGPLAPEKYQTKLNRLAAIGSHTRGCGNAADHLGKWSVGNTNQRLHYVCKSNFLAGVNTRCGTYGWASFGHHCYHVELNMPLPYADAMLSCQLMDAQLVTIKSEAENSFVKELVSGQTVWIGISSDGLPAHGNWSDFATWVDGTPLRTAPYTNWDKHQPATFRDDSVAAFMNDWNALCLPSPWQQWQMNFAAAAFVIVVATLWLLTLLVACVAKVTYLCCYKSSVTDKRFPFPGVAVHAQQLTDFHHSAFGCFGDMDACIHSCCCPMIRAADTHKAAGTSEFWSVILYWIVYFIIACDPLIDKLIGTSGQFYAGIIFAILMTRKRLLLKAKFGIAPVCGCTDFLLWWCCMPCAIAQEARHVDEVTGAKVSCCCSLAQNQISTAHPVVGPAVSLPYLATEAIAIYHQPMLSNYAVMSPINTAQLVHTAQLVSIQPAGAPGVTPLASQAQPLP